MSRALPLRRSLSAFAGAAIAAQHEFRMMDENGDAECPLVDLRLPMRHLPQRNVFGKMRHLPQRNDLSRGKDAVFG